MPLTININIQLFLATFKNIGNTAQLRCADCAVRFFVRLYKNFAGLLTQVKKFLCSMTETASSKACASICAVLP